MKNIWKNGTRLIAKHAIALALLGLGSLAFANSEVNATKPATSTLSTSSTQTLPKLIDLGSTKCIPCKMMIPILEALKKENAGRMEVIFIDVRENKDAAGQYGIKMIPTQIFQDGSGKELFRHEGFFAKSDILEKWKALGFPLEPQSAVQPK